MAPDKKMKQIMRYTGDGDYILGVPARDLSVDEFEALPEGIREQCVDNGLYEVADAPEPESDEGVSEDA